MKRQQIVFVLYFSFVLTLGLSAQAQEQPDTPTRIADAYLEAIETSDLDRAEALFAHESSVFESGGVEGTWQHYREHHIGEELEELASFTIARGDASEGECRWKHGLRRLAD